MPVDASLVYTSPTIAGALAARQEPDRQGVKTRVIASSRQCDHWRAGSRTNGLPVASLGREGTLTAFYGNPRQVPDCWRQF